MAVTKIKPIRGTVNKALAYILDPQKTDDAFYRAVYQKVGKVSDARHNDSIVLTAYRKIEEAGIWIPMGEVEKYFFSRKNAFRKRYEKELARTELLAEAKEVYPHS